MIALLIHLLVCPIYIYTLPVQLIGIIAVPQHGNTRTPGRFEMTMAFTRAGVDKGGTQGCFPLEETHPHRQSTQLREHQNW